MTALPGEETQVSLSPDGEFIVYAGDASGNKDIYIQRVGGQNPINLTKDNLEDDHEPAYSPDGKQIAFRSERQGGGIYVMGATGESAKRITPSGFRPAWSPDGKQIVFCSQDFAQVQNRGDFSELWTVNVLSGQTHQLTRRPLDAIQPNWSPNGKRIAAWSAPIAPRDIVTISAESGESVPVTNDPYMDWSPSWSPDGKFLYFASDRSGSMNLWRVAIDEESGKVLGEPEPITTPSRWTGYFSFSRDGNKMAFASADVESNIQRIAFDPAQEQVVGQNTPVISGNRMLDSASLSPDGNWLVLSKFSGQEDLMIARADGSDMRSLTDGEFKDRDPRWLSDGRIVFQSDRAEGVYEAWSIRPDGSELKQLSRRPDKTFISGVWNPKPAPDAKRLAANNENGCYIINIGGTLPSSDYQPLPPIPIQNAYFNVNDWSPNGELLVGIFTGMQGDIPGIVVYSFQSRLYEKITDSGSAPSWLSDSRRVLFSAKGKLMLADTKTRKVRELLSPVPGKSFDVPLAATDDRMIYFSQTSIGSDIWMMTLHHQ